MRWATLWRSISRLAGSLKVSISTLQAWVRGAARSVKTPSTRAATAAMARRGPMDAARSCEVLPHSICRTDASGRVMSIKGMADLSLKGSLVVGCRARHPIGPQGYPPPAPGQGEAGEGVENDAGDAPLGGGRHHSRQGQKAERDLPGFHALEGRIAQGADHGHRHQAGQAGHQPG